MIHCDDHCPPHFHVKYSEKMAAFDIETLDIIAGELPPKAENMVIEWAHKHRKELIDNWNRAQKHIPLNKIEPLE